MSSRHYGRITSSGACSTNIREEKFVWVEIVVGKHEGKRPLETVRHRLEDNIKRYMNVIDFMDVAHELHLPISVNTE
jgi:hypothetical protein